jgi:hypothetical protein
MTWIRSPADRDGLAEFGTPLIQPSTLGRTATLMDRYDRRLRQSLKPNLLIYRTVINALCNDGNVRDAQHSQSHG